MGPEARPSGLAPDLDAAERGLHVHVHAIRGAAPVLAVPGVPTLLEPEVREPGEEPVELHPHAGVGA